MHNQPAGLVRKSIQQEMRPRSNQYRDARDPWRAGRLPAQRKKQFPVTFRQYSNERQTKAVIQNQQDNADRQSESKTPKETVGKFIKVPSSETITDIGADASNHQCRKIEMSRAATSERQDRRGMSQGKWHGKVFSAPISRRIEFRPPALDCAQPWFFTREFSSAARPCFHPTPSCWRHLPCLFPHRRHPGQCRNSNTARRE